MAANITITNAQAAGSLRALPGATWTDIAATAISFKSGKAIGNNVLLGLGAFGDDDHTIDRYKVTFSNDSAGSIDLIVDVSGFFRPTANDPLPYTIREIAPSGPLLDIRDWMTMDSDLVATSHLVGRSVHHDGTSSPGEMWTYFDDSRHLIYFLKDQPDGLSHTYDTVLYDSNFLYNHNTEVGGDYWGDETYFKRSTLHTNLFMMPRFARGSGSCDSEQQQPGTRIVSSITSQTQFNACVPDARTFNVGKAIYELYGPCPVDLGGPEPGYSTGLGLQSIIKITYWWLCTANTRDSCAQAETNWYSKRYGWVSWNHWVRDEDGVMQLYEHSYLNTLTSGTNSPKVPPCLTFE